MVRMQEVQRRLDTTRPCSMTWTFWTFTLH